MSDDPTETDSLPSTRPLEAARREAAAYRHGEHRPLGSFTAIMLAPRGTRLVASAFASLAGADFLHIAYALSEERLRG